MFERYQSNRGSKYFEQAVTSSEQNTSAASTPRNWLQEVLCNVKLQLRATKLPKRCKQQHTFLVNAVPLCMIPPKPSSFSVRPALAYPLTYLLHGAESFLRS